MEISSSSPAMMMQAKALDAVRTTLANAAASSSTPQAQADVILQLSTAAQQLLTTSR